MSGVVIQQKHHFGTRLVLSVFLALALAGCTRTNNFSDLQIFIDEVKARPGAPVEPVPVFEPYEAFSYSAASLRSPFDVPVVIQGGENGQNSRDVAPDLERAREVLEGYALSELTMVGMLERSGSYVALIEDSSGQIHRVSVGNYLGRNHGRVRQITATQLDLTEIVPSGDGGWVERPQSLTLVP